MDLIFLNPLLLRHLPAKDVNIVQSLGKFLKTGHCIIQDHINNRYLYMDDSLELHTQKYVTLTSLPAMQW